MAGTAPVILFNATTAHEVIRNIRLGLFRLILTLDLPHFIMNYKDCKCK